jgi:adenine-specific DNA methylase
VDTFVLRRFEKEQVRRVANLEIAARLTDNDPALASNPILQRWRDECRPLPAQWTRDGVELQVIKVPGDPDFANSRIELETANRFRTPDDKYGYDRAFEVAPVLPATPMVVLDPSAGGGSIPFEALRLGNSVIANELNPVAAVILYCTLDFPLRFGPSLGDDIAAFGDSLLREAHDRLAEFFPSGTIPASECAVLKTRLSATPEIAERYLEETLDGFLFCRQVTCPTCTGEAPLLNSCWLAKDDVEPWAVRLVSDRRARGGKVLFEPYRVIAGRGPYGEEPDFATVANGVGSCVHCRQAIPEDEIKAQAQGRSEYRPWTDRLFCVAAVRFEPKLDANGRPEHYKSGKRKGEIKTRKVRFFRPANDRDLDAIEAAERCLVEKWPAWDGAGLIPGEEIPRDSNYNRGHRLYGMTRWCDLFTPRQLVGHLTLAEELLRLKPQIITALGNDRGRAVVSYLQFAIDKGIDYNSKLTRWEYTRGVVKGPLAGTTSR